MEKLTVMLRKLSDFLDKEIWQDPDKPGRRYLFYYELVRIVLMTVRGLNNRMILLRASALSYSTLLAIVPMLAIAFSMLKGLEFHTRIEQILVNYLTAEQEALTSRIIEYISGTNFKALGAFGTALLIYASVMLLSNVEHTFNELWGVSRHRSISRKISNYVSVLFLGPFLMVLSTAMMASFSSNTIVTALMKFDVFRHFFILFSEIIPHAALWIAFTVIYMLLPNTRVKFIPALVAGIICASVWEGAFRVYTGFNIGLARYNTIYGTFAVLPIFFIWLYISWLIVLIGAQLSYAIQNVRSYRMEVALADVGHAQKEVMALHIMVKIASRFQQGLPPVGTEALSRDLAMPVRLVAEITQKLCEYGLIQPISSDEMVFGPSKNIDLISVLDVCKALRHEADDSWQVPENEENTQLVLLLESREKSETRELGNISIQDLISGSNGLASH